MKRRNHQGLRRGQEEGCASAIFLLSVLLPKQADKLLALEGRYKCDLKRCCVPHDTCFIHNSCFCEGSSSFPPVKPPHLSWSDFSYDWYCELASCLKLHPHSPLPHFGSEVEYSPLVMLYYCVLPSAD